MVLSGQILLARDRIPRSVRRILWINQTAPSLGDALMDTAGRTLLAGRRVSLLTSRKNAMLFERDAVFESVFSDWRSCKAAARKPGYDLVILDSYSPRTIGLKILVAPLAPFVGLFGFLNAYEVHRSTYSFRRLERLLGFPSTPKTRLSHGLKPSARRPRYASGPILVVGIGGEWEFRTYQHWDQVIPSVLGLGFSVVLLGSQNGVADAQRLERRFGGVVNLVGNTDLSEAAEVLSQAELYIGADGGLWHLASACGVPSVALHADCQLFDASGTRVSRAAEEPACIALHASERVSDISPDKVIEAVIELNSRPRSLIHTRKLSLHSDSE